MLQHSAFGSVLPTAASGICRRPGHVLGWRESRDLSHRWCDEASMRELVADSRSALPAPVPLWVSAAIPTCIEKQSQPRSEWTRNP